MTFMTDNQHLSDKDLAGYLYGTLTDARRETIDRHLAGCAACRTGLSAEQQFQRRLHNELAADLRRVRPDMHFEAEAIRSHRRWIPNRISGFQLLVRAAAVAAVLVLILFVYAARPGSFNPLSSFFTPGSPLFNIDWEDSVPYRPGLIPAEQGALAQLSDAPVYHLQISLADNLHSVSGRQAVRYTNRTGRPLNEIYLRLLPNRYESLLSVSQIQVNNRPVTGQIEDRTNLRLDLPQSLPAGGEVVIGLEFTLELPTSRRLHDGTLSRISDVASLDYFYPLVAAHQDGAWLLDWPWHNTVPVVEDGFYLVQVTAPRNVTLITSGVETNRLTDMDTGRPTDTVRQTTTYSAGPVDRFYLTASDRFTVQVSNMVGDTRINSYVVADFLVNDANQVLQTATAVMRDYNELFGNYPFTELDIVGSPNLAFARPGLSMAGLILYANDYTPSRATLNTVVARGVADQWFARIVGVQAVQEPWLAFSLSEYSRLAYVNLAPSGDGPPLSAAELDEYWATCAGKNQESVVEVPLGLPAAGYRSIDFEYISRCRGPQFLSLLAGEMGPEAMTALLSSYYEQFRWATPTTAAFRDQAELYCRCDLETLFTAWVYPPPRK